MDDKITIIEGPSPTFETINELWAQGLTDSETLSEIVMTHLRTINGPTLVERCHRAWDTRGTISLEYRTSEGFETETPIVAARNIPTEDGDMLILWLRMSTDSYELEFGFDDDSTDIDEDDWTDGNEPF